MKNKIKTGIAWMVILLLSGSAIVALGYMAMPHTLEGWKALGGVVGFIAGIFTIYAAMCWAFKKVGLLDKNASWFD